MATVQLPDGAAVSYTWGDTAHEPMCCWFMDGTAGQLSRCGAAARWATRCWRSTTSHGASVDSGDAADNGSQRAGRCCSGCASLPVIAHSLGAAAVASVMVADPRAVTAAVLIAPPDRVHSCQLPAASARPMAVDDVQREAEGGHRRALAALVADVAFARRIDAAAGGARRERLRCRSRTVASTRRRNAHARNRRPRPSPHPARCVIDASVRFIAEHHTPAELNIARLPSAPMPASPGREHRDMLTDVGAMAQGAPAERREKSLFCGSAERAAARSRPTDLPFQSECVRCAQRIAATRLIQIGEVLSCNHCAAAPPRCGAGGGAPVVVRVERRSRRRASARVRPGARHQAERQRLETQEVAELAGVCRHV